MKIILSQMSLSSLPALPKEDMGRIHWGILWNSGLRFLCKSPLEPQWSFFFFRISKLPKMCGFWGSSTPGVGNVDPRGLVFWLGLELNSAGEWPSRINVPHPCSTQSSYIICTCSCIALTVVCRSHFVIQIDWSIMYNACMLLVKLLLVLTFSKYENNVKTYPF